MREVDRLMVDVYGIQLIQMMENAGRHLAGLSRSVLGGVRGQRILVASGKGNNGAATMTLTMPKAGLLAPEAKQFVGRLYLVDIGVPPGVYEHLGLHVGPIFADADLISLG